MGIFNNSQNQLNQIRILKTKINKNNESDLRTDRSNHIDLVRRQNALTRNLATYLSPFRPDRYRLVVSVTCPTSTQPSSTKKLLTSIILPSNDELFAMSLNKKTTLFNK
ncbi:hypothetical protein Hanom_Chr09g00815751 [Helianthus anomalus]